MKTSTNKTPPPQTPVFPETLHRMRPIPGAIAGEPPSPPKAQKRENTFSKSRDTREDRGTRRMKTAQSSQTFPHGK